MSNFLQAILLVIASILTLISSLLFTLGTNTTKFLISTPTTNASLNMSLSQFNDFNQNLIIGSSIAMRNFDPTLLSQLTKEQWTTVAGLGLSPLDIPKITNTIKSRNRKLLIPISLREMELISKGQQSLKLNFCNPSTAADILHNQRLLQKKPGEQGYVHFSPDGSSLVDPALQNQPKTVTHEFDFQPTIEWVKNVADDFPGFHTIIVLTPYCPAYTNINENLIAQVQAFNPTALPDNIEFINLSSVMIDSTGFYDSHHMNQIGATECTKNCAQFIDLPSRYDVNKSNRQGTNALQQP